MKVAVQKLTFSQIVTHVIFIMLCLICIVPLLLVLSISLTNERSLLLDGYRFIPNIWSIKAYKYVFSGASSVINAYSVTIFVTFVGTVLHLLITSMLSYALSRREVTLRNIISLFVYIPVLFNGGLVPTYILLTRTLKLKNTIWVLIIVYLVSAIHVLIMKNFFKSIPDSLIESARIDGSGEFRTFFQIVIPLSIPSIATIGLFVSIAYWNDWITCSLYIERQNLYTLQFLLQSLMNNIGYLQANVQQASRSAEKLLAELPSEGARMATCVLSIGPIILLYPFLQKYVVRGLIIGAVKG
ncbi:MAG TPA: carbohydrate ABC transporter permease [Clostridiaceae bacterium]|nr:carbohydrate ABC transporter permease [Clostridiaceae bacterium]